MVEEFPANKENDSTPTARGALRKVLEKTENEVVEMEQLSDGSWQIKRTEVEENGKKEREKKPKSKD